ncbi:hypothetical protein PhCBS80983_g01786 [Powellomyces hirtus]|uniref:Uncharacterized protein n=1 Tax=Powellomyces hirtus TaxID=109895 RepID=A0A507E8M3_9FUNG|nr:hypothetical protein PhCBS80983_g01786 [Powellomyces hirtus]
MATETRLVPGAKAPANVRSTGSPPPADTIESYAAAIRAQQQQMRRPGGFGGPAIPKKRSYGWSVLRVATIILSSVVLATYMANVAVTHDKEQRVVALLAERRKLREEEQELKRQLDIE